MCRQLCEAFREFMAAQREELKKEIDIDKWFESEKAGHDVGWSKAEQHYLETYFPKFAKTFRRKFCYERCPKKYDCEGKKVEIGEGCDVHQRETR